MKSLKATLMAGALLLSLAAPVLSQDQPLYTRIASWNLARMHWADFEKDFKKNQQPVMEKLLADGVITQYGVDAVTVHTADGQTHSTWFSSRSLANLEKALDTLVAASEKLGPEERRRQNTDFAGEKHRDFIVRSLVHKVRPANQDKGYDMASFFTVKPGKGPEYLELWNKYNKPTLEQLLAEGTISAYGLDVEQVHTNSPLERVMWFVMPNAEALDKIEAAFEAARNKVDAVERRAIGALFAEVTEPGTHRDAMFRIIRYAAK
jgi:hypothetical protein